jgi:hypothetical protein
MVTLNQVTPITIPDLDAATTLTGNELVPISQANEAVNVAVNALPQGMTAGVVVYGNTGGSPFPNFRTLTAGSGIDITDGGAQSSLTIALSSSGTAAPKTASYVVIGTDAGLTNERVIAVGSALTLTDGGANGNVTIGTSALSGAVTSSANSFVTSLSAGIDAQLIANGSVTSVEFQYLDGVTSNIQTQLNAKGSGSVTSVSVVSVNGVSGSVATATTTPAISLTLGAITPSSVAASGSVTGSNLSGTNTGDQTITLTGAVTGTGTSTLATTIATPGTLTVASTNSTATAHTHAITSSSAPGAAASILATDSSGIIGSTGTRITKGWFTDLTVTNAISGSVTGNSGTVTTNANLSGVITSSGNVTSITTQTGTGTTFVVSNSPTLVTPTLGIATATRIGLGQAADSGAVMAATGQYFSTQATCTVTLDWNNGNVQYIVLTNGGQTFTFANPKAGGRYALILKQPAASSAGTVTWPATVLWPAGSAPTLTATNSKVDVITFIYDGTNTKYYGGSSLNY